MNDSVAETLSAPPQTQLPVIERPIDNTAMQAYMACPREYKFGMVEHRRTKEIAAPLAFGAGWHTMMEAHYKGADRDLVQYMVQRSWEDHGAEGDYRTLERLFLVYDKYLKRYDVEKDRAETLGYPDNPLVEVSAHAMGGPLIHPYAGKLDRIVDLGGLLWIEDHKTTSRMDRHFFSKFENDNQMKGYVFLADQLIPDRKVMGARVNVAHVTKTKTDFQRELVPYAPDKIEEWARNYNTWAQRISDDTIRYHLERGKTPEELDVTPQTARFLTRQDAFPGHFGTNGCARKYGLCQYYRACGASERIRERVLEQDFVHNPWNPLEKD